jgi:arylsulfatase
MANSNGKLKAVNESPRQFGEEIELDIRDSKPDWPFFLSKKAAEGAPNVLVIFI